MFKNKNGFVWEDEPFFVVFDWKTLPEQILFVIFLVTFFESLSYLSFSLPVVFVDDSYGDIFLATLQVPFLKINKSKKIFNPLILTNEKPKGKYLAEK